MARVSASHTPRQPWGKNPPCWVKFANPTARHGPRASDEQHSQGDENHNGEDFDEREPIFQLTKIADLQGVECDQPSGYEQDPYPSGDMGKPEGKVNGGGGYLRPDRDDLYQAIGGANGKTSPGAEILLGIDSKGPGHGMYDGHFG